IVPIYEAGHDDTHHYIASALIEGKTLAQAVDDGPIELPRAVEIVRALAEALAYAHDLGIVHRDVKPANVILDVHGQPLLTDFGIAHRDDAATKLTGEGALIGTPAYMSPEQARGESAEAVPASDEYSLGVVLYELLCGHVPFRGPAQVVLLRIRNDDPPLPSSVNPAVPPELERICLKALAKKAQDRYPSCRDFAHDLQRWLLGETVQAAAPAVAAAKRAPSTSERESATDDETESVVTGGRGKAL